MIYEIDSEHELEACRRACKSVFRSLKVFERPFAPAVEARESIVISAGSDELRPLGDLTARFGEDRTYLTYEVAEPGGIRSCNFAIDLKSYSGGVEPWDYGYLDCALYGSSGQWGILYSDAGYQLVGGPRDFVRDFLASPLVTDDQRTAAGRMLAVAELWPRLPGGVRQTLEYLYGATYIDVLREAGITDGDRH